MKITQEVQIDGDDLILTMRQHGKPDVLATRRWRGAAKYVVGRQKKNDGITRIVLAIPERAGFNIKPG